jgi:hypothetical protein
MDYVQGAVVDVLNEIFDSSEVASANALAKFGKNSKKTKKKDDAPVQNEETTVSDEEKRAVVEAAAANAKPFSTLDAMVTAATREEFGDYQVNAAMGLAKALGMNPRFVPRPVVL